MALLDDIKKLISSVENEKPEDKPEEPKKVKNEKVDKRKLIDEVGGILKGKVDDEIIRTIIGKLEKVAYDKSEAGTVDNEDDEPAKDKKEVAEIKEEVKEDVENKCKNSVENGKDNEYFDKLMKIYNSSVSVKEPETDYVSTAAREKDAEDYFKA